MKVCIISRLHQTKMKTIGIDTQKWTLACICYTMGGIRVVGQIDAYHMHVKAYYMHAKQVHTRSTPKLNFAYQYHEYTIYTHFYV